jgi:hypothetical protein
LNGKIPNMRINGTLLLTSVLLLGAFFLVRSDEGLLQGAGYAFVAGACIVQLRYVVKSVSAYRKRRLIQG